jgi:hypothetical protein
MTKERDPKLLKGEIKKSDVRNDPCSSLWFHSPFFLQFLFIVSQFKFRRRQIVSLFCGSVNCDQHEVSVITFVSWSRRNLENTVEFPNDALHIAECWIKKNKNRYGSASASCLAAGKSISSLERVVVSPSHSSSMFSFYFLGQFFGSCWCFFQLRHSGMSTITTPVNTSLKLCA